MEYITRDYLDEKFDDFAALMAKHFGLCATKEDLLETRVEIRKEMREVEKRLENKISANATLNRREYESLTVRTSRLEDAVFDSE